MQTAPNLSGQTHQYRLCGKTTSHEKIAAGIQSFSIQLNREVTYYADGEVPVSSELITSSTLARIKHNVLFCCPTEAFVTTSDMGDNVVGVEEIDCHTENSMNHANQYFTSKLNGCLCGNALLSVNILISSNVKYDAIAYVQSCFNCYRDCRLGCGACGCGPCQKSSGCDFGGCCDFSGYCDFSAYIPFPVIIDSSTGSGSVYFYKHWKLYAWPLYPYLRRLVREVTKDFA